MQTIKVVITEIETPKRRKAAKEKITSNYKREGITTEYARN